MKNLKNILVTGANGQLGKCIQDVVKKYPQHTFHFKSSKDLDITNNTQVENLFNKEKYDYCINCAAYTAVDRAEEDEQNAFLVNAEGVKFLAEACKSFETVLIHISTDFVFDGTKKSPYVENDKPNPINVYGVSKLKGEEYIKSILEKYYIIRTSWVYSEYGNNFVKTMLRLGRERDELSVVNDQFGSPTYAGDLAHVILEIIASKKENYGIYHYSNEGIINWHDFATEIFKVAVLSINISAISTDKYPTPAKRPLYGKLDNTLLHSKFNSPPIHWKKSLTDLLILKKFKKQHL